MLKKPTVVLYALVVLVFFSCNDKKEEEKKEPAAISDGSMKVESRADDSNYIKVTEVAAMMKVLEDSLAKLKIQNQSAKAAPMQTVNFANRTEPYMGHIKWMWENPNPPAQMRCLAYIINGDGPPKLRGNATAHACVVNAIQAYRQDKLELAINWLKAGQCHNDQAQSEIAAGGQMAVQWALQEYGKDVPQ